MKYRIYVYNAVAYKSQYTPYERFLGVLNSPETKRNYTKNLKYFLRFCQLDNYSDLIEKLERVRETRYDIRLPYVSQK